MKKDILFPKVEGIDVVAAQRDVDWAVYLINNNNFPLRNLIVASSGFEEGEDGRKTSVIRQHFDRLEANSFLMVELIDPMVFGMVNQYWVSFYKDEVNSQIYDRRFVFEAGTITKQNLFFIPELEMNGVYGE